jgi:hypothetical protein
MPVDRLIAGLVGLVVGAILSAALVLLTDPNASKLTAAEERAAALEAQAATVRKPSEPAAGIPDALVDLAKEDTTDGAEPAPENWRIVEGRVLGVRSGNWPRFAYLPGDDFFGVSRQAAADHLGKTWPKLARVDASNGSLGECLALELDPSITALLCGSWQNLHAIAVLGGWPAGNATDYNLHRFSGACVSALMAATGERAQVGELSREWITHEIKEHLVGGGDSRTIERDNVLITLSIGEMEGFEQDSERVHAWFLVKAKFGPTGLRSASEE